MKREWPRVLHARRVIATRMYLIRMMALRKLLLFCSLIVPMTAFAAGNDFYQRMYNRGMTHFAAAEYASAYTELRTAAFGFVGEIDRFETAHAYAGIAAHRLGRDADTRDSLARIAIAEKIEPRFQAVTLPDDVRAEINKLAAALLTRQESTLLGVSKEMQDAAAAQKSAVVVPTPSKRPNVAVTAPRESGGADAAEPPPAKPPAASVESKLADAQRALEGGDAARASAIYDALLNGPALDHAPALRLAEGLCGTHEYAKAARAFEMAGTIGAGEERFRYCHAVALYETGHFGDAKRELAAAIPHIAMTPDVAAYRTKIEGAKE